MTALTKGYGHKISPAHMKSVNKAIEVLYYKTGILMGDKESLSIYHKNDHSSLLTAGYISNSNL